MIVSKLDHVALLTADARRAARFYCEWAGMEIIHERHDEDSDNHVIWVRLKDDTDGLTIVLLEGHGIRSDGRMDHFGFHVGTRSDVNALAEHARGQGILVDEPQYAGPVVGYFCTIKDPDGNLVEFACDQLMV